MIQAPRSTSTSGRALRNPSTKPVEATLLLNLPNVVGTDGIRFQGEMVKGTVSELREGEGFQAIRMTNLELPVGHPRGGTMAIAGLNPHSGENGLFGDEPTMNEGTNFTEFSIQMNTSEKRLPLAQVRYELARLGATHIETVPLDSCIPGLDAVSF